MSLPQVAAKMLPMEASRTLPDKAGMFSLALADALGLGDTATDKADAVISSAGRKDDKVKPKSKDEKKSSARDLAGDKHVQDVAVPITLATTIAPPAASLEILEKTAPVATADTKSARQVESVSSPRPTTGHVNFPSTFLSRAPLTVAAKLSFDQQPHAPGAQQVSRSIGTIEPHQARADGPGNIILNAGSSDVIQKKDDEPVAVTSIPATQSSPKEAVAEIIAAALPTPASAPGTKETRPMRPIQQGESTQPLVGGVSQKSSSSLQSHTADFVRAINKVVSPSASLGTAKDPDRRGLSRSEHKPATQKETPRIPPVASQRTDAVSRGSQHSKSELAPGTSAGIQGHSENTQATPANKAEVTPSAQVNYAADGRELQRGNADKITAPAVSGVAHSAPGTTHLNADEVSPAPPVSVVHAAKLVERLGQSELRVGLHTGEFGKVDIRTSLGRNQFTAEISVERGELGRALSADLPTLHTRLAEQHLPAANITVQHYSAGASTDQHGSRQNKTFTPMSLTRGGQGDASLLPAIGEAMESTTGLDIHM